MRKTETYVGRGERLLSPPVRLRAFKKIPHELGALRGIFSLNRRYDGVVPEQVRDRYCCSGVFHRGILPRLSYPQVDSPGLVYYCIHAQATIYYRSCSQREGRNTLRFSRFEHRHYVLALRPGRFGIWFAYCFRQRLTGDRELLEGRLYGSRSTVIESTRYRPAQGNLMDDKQQGARIQSHSSPGTRKTGTTGP